MTTGMHVIIIIIIIIIITTYLQCIHYNMNIICITKVRSVLIGALQWFLVCIYNKRQKLKVYNNV